MGSRLVGFSTAVLLGLFVACLDSPTEPLPCSIIESGRCWADLGPRGQWVEAIALRGDQIWIGLRDHGLQVFNRNTGRWQQRGFDGKSVTSITVLPNSGRMWVTLRPSGSDTVTAVAYVSDNGGTTWRPSDGGLSAATGFHGLAWDLTYDPQNLNRLYLGQAGNIARTVDGGSIWTEVFGSVQNPGVAMAPIVVAPSDPAQIWAGGQDGGQYASLLWSNDSGETWQRFMSIAYPDDAATALAVDPINPGRILLGMSGAVRLTEDTGTSWTPVLTIGNSGFVTGLWIADSFVVAVADKQGAAPPVTTLGLFTGSRDGRSWDTVGAPSLAVGGTALVMRQDGNVFIGTRDGVWAVQVP